MTARSGARPTLRPVARADASGVVACLGDLEVARNLVRVPVPYTLEHANEWLDRVEADAGERNQTLAIDAGGFCGVVNIVAGEDGPLLSYFLLRSHWGRGIMGEAVDAAIKLYFDTRPGDRILSAILEGNVASLKLQKRIGFVQTGSSMLYCHPREREVKSIATELSRSDYEKRAP